MNVAALWHHLECGGYAEDLPLWRELADETGGPVLDVGAGTGRVSVDLATRGTPVVALDVDAPLLEALAQRAVGLPVETVVGDARALSLPQRFRLIVVPMQTLQLLGGPDGRAAFLRGALHHLEPGGLLAAALADALDCFDDEHELPPPPQACEVGGMRYSSQLVAVREEDGRAALHRVRAIDGEAENVIVRLDRVTAAEVEAQARAIGFHVEPARHVPETEEYLGSTVVMLRTT